MSWRGTNYSKKNFPSSGSPFFYVYSDRSSNQVFYKEYSRINRIKLLLGFFKTNIVWFKSRVIILEIEPIQLQHGLFMTINIKVNKIVYSDTSETGYGGYIVHVFDKIIAKGQFNSEEKDTSSTYRELLAVKHILESLKSPLENQRVQWFSDNSNVTRIINFGSTRTHLQTLALVDIYNICFKNNIILYPASLDPKRTQ